jgi:hypothetical protein
MKMERPRDIQRSRVYRWEDEVAKKSRGVLSKKLTLSQCQVLAAKAYGRYHPDLPAPIIYARRGTRTALSNASRNKINLPNWARTPGVVLHEVAHLVTPNTNADHGPEFVRMMCDLWKWYTGYSGNNYPASAKRAGLSVALPMSIKRPAPKYRE